VGEVTDFMPIAGTRPTDKHRLVRLLRTVRGTMRFVMEVKPRFDYGRAPHKLEISDDGFVFSSNGMDLTLNPVGERTSPLAEQGLAVERAGDDIRLTRTLREGETGGVLLESMGGQPRRIPPAEMDQLIGDTTWPSLTPQSTSTTSSTIGPETWSRCSPGHRAPRRPDAVGRSGASRAVWMRRDE
jgi:hypothetical protein